MNSVKRNHPGSPRHKNLKAEVLSLTNLALEQGTEDQQRQQQKHLQIKMYFLGNHQSKYLPLLVKIDMGGLIANVEEVAVDLGTEFLLQKQGGFNQPQRPHTTLVLI